MKKLIVLGVALGLLGGAAAAAPTIQVDADTYAVTIPAGTQVKHTFVITNAGDATLTLSSVRTSCGCTTTALAKRDLAPGESVDLDATVNTTGFTGTVIRTITVTSNDPVHASTTLKFEITIGDAPPTVPEISASDLKIVFYILIDVRTPEDYAAGHLIGAISVPLAEIQADTAAWAARLPRDIPIILYGADGTGGRDACVLFLSAGLSNVLNLTGGLAAWNAVLGQGTLYAP